MSLTENSEEFIVCRGKVELIDSLKSKIERLFGTRIYFNEVSKDGDKEKRWVKVTGGKWDRQNAKTYILGLSDPAETKTIKCSADFVDEEVLEDIEKNTNAVLSKPSADVISISGNELAVTLALSALEELTGSSHDVSDNNTPDTDFGAEKTRNGLASKRLDEKLDETFGDVSGSLHNLPPNIKRVFLEFGTHQEDDISEEQLHGSGFQTTNNQNSRKTSSEIILRAQEEKDPRKCFTAPICRSVTSETKVGDDDRIVDVADGVSERRSSEGVSTVTEKFPSAAQITPVKHQTGRLGRGSDAESLREFAKNVGYTDEEVDEGLLYVQPPMRPSDFLAALKSVKENKKSLGLDDETDRRMTSHATDNKVVISDDEDEDDLMIVDDHFKSTEQNKKPLSPKSKQGGLSKQEKKKNEQKQKDLEREYQKQKNNKGRKKKQSSPQNVNTSGTKRKSDPDSDHEQTCVMKVWEPGPDLPDRVPPNPPRHQRLLGPVHPGSEANPAPLPHPRSRQGQNRPNAQYPIVSSSSDSSVSSPPQATHGHRDDLRYVIIDGSNVAMFHGNGKVFSCKGIQIAVDYFLDLGHKVTVFVPEWRKYRNNPNNRILDQEILQKLEEAGHLVFTPSRKIQGKLKACYDDRFILSLAEKEDSVILSNDQFRDLMLEKASWRKIVEERLLMYRFVHDHFFPAEDPLGRDGPMLEEFLRKQPKTSPTIPARVPFYQQQTKGWPRLPNNNHGNYQPIIGQWQSDGIAPQQMWSQSGAQGQWQERVQTPLLLGNLGYQNVGQDHWQRRERPPIPRPQPVQRAPNPQDQDPQKFGNHGYQKEGQGPWQGREQQTFPTPQPGQRPPNPQKKDFPIRHPDVTEQLMRQLKSVFPEPGQEEELKRVLDNHSSETDLNRLTNYCMEVIFK